MKELRETLTSDSIQQLQTYIQSGNLAFRSELPPTEIMSFIQQKIKENFNFDIPVFVLPLDQLSELFDNNPYLKENVDTKHLHLTIVQSKIDSESFSTEEKTTDSFILTDSAIYIHTPSGYGKTKFNNTFFEKKLKQHTTTRNWRTVSKMIELSEKQ